MNKFLVILLFFSISLFADIPEACHARKFSQNYSNIVESLNYAKNLTIVALHIKMAIKNSHFNTIVQLDSAESYTCERIEKTLQNKGYTTKCQQFCPSMDKYGVCKYSFVELIQVAW